MTDIASLNVELFKGLKELSAASYPKKCRNCGREYLTMEQFLFETQDIQTAKTCLKQSLDDDGSKIVDVFRNCVCGSTLIESFNNRRDLSEAGIKRRGKFEDILNLLEQKNIDRRTARAELIKVLHGGDSEILSGLLPPDKRLSAAE